jgi:hypothetical protein
MMRRLIKLALIGTAVHWTAATVFRQQRNRYAGHRRHIMVVQGGLQLRPAEEDVRDAVVSVLMGGVVLDLRHTRLAQPPSRLDILCVMGGVELVVPPDWKLRIEVQPTMGGVEDSRRGRIDTERAVDLIVSGRVVMGGLEIRDSAAAGD